MSDVMTFEDPWIDVDLSEYEGIDPSAPSPAAPGSELKVQTLAARYAAGVSLWHDEDCSDHGLAIDRPVVDDDNAAPLNDFDSEETDDVEELEPALA